MKITLRYVSWIKGEGVPCDAEYKRNFSVSSKIDKSHLCKILGAMGLAEHDGRRTIETWTNKGCLEDGRTYNIRIRNTNKQKDLLEKFYGLPYKLE